MEMIMVSQTIARQYKEGAGVEIIFANNGIVVGKACTVVYNGKPNAFLHGFEVKKTVSQKWIWHSDSLIYD